MTGLPIDLQKLPPKALDVIRFLGTRDEGASSDEIIAGTGLSQRAFGKAIRRLVTRQYVVMPEREFYELTDNGREAAQTLREHDGAQSDVAQGTSASAAPGPAPEPARAPTQAAELAPESDASPEPMPEKFAVDEPTPEPAESPTQASERRAELELSPVPDESSVAWHRRRLSAFMPKEMVQRAPAPLRVGFDAPAERANPLHEPARIVLRVNVPGCRVEPRERPLEVAPGAAAGPVRFRITPDSVGSARVRIEAFQLVADQLIPAGGVYFDLPVSEFPTPDSAEFQTLAATLRLHPGEAHA